MAKSGMPIGQTRGKKRREQRVREEDLSIHVHILGRPGMGKSWLMKQMLQTDIEHNARQQGPGLCLIDPAGDVFDFALACIGRNPAAQQRLRIIDASQGDYFVGLNYLEHDPERVSAANHVETVIAGINKAFGQEDAGAKPRMERMLRMVLQPLILEGLTFGEVGRFGGGDPSFRDALLDKLLRAGRIAPAQRDEWGEFNRLPIREQANLMESVLNRISKFAASKENEYVFCQGRSTIDFRQAMDERQIVLCKLTGQRYSKEQLNLMGIIITDKIVQAGLSRADIPEHKRVPFRFYIDEFARFASNDVATGLDELRKYKVSFVLAHQRLEQLRQDSPNLCDAVLTCCNVRVLFSTSAADAEIMVGEAFTESMAQNQVKHVQEMDTVLPGKEETRTILSVTDSESESSGVTDTEGEGWGEGFGTTDSVSAGTSLVYGGDGNFFLSNPMSTTQINLNATGSSSHSLRSGQRSTAYSTATARGRAIGQTVVPFVPSRIVRQVTSIQFFSPEEKRLRLIDRIVRQQRQEAFVQVGRNAPIPITTITVEDPGTIPASIAKVERDAYEKNHSALLAAAVEQQFLERREAIAGLIAIHREQRLTDAEDAEFEVLEDEPEGKSKPKRVKMARGKTKKGKFD